MSSYSPSKTHIISIEGNIGSGKSTLVRILEKNLQKIIQLNKTKLSRKSKNLNSNSNPNNVIYPSSNSDLTNILMNNYTVTHDNELDIDLDIVTSTNDNHNNSKLNSDGFVKKIFNYIMQNAFGTKMVDLENLKICFLPEPVDEWSSVVDEEGKTILERFYSNQSKYAFSFQMMAYITRLKQFREALSQNYDIIITERCVHTDKEVFAKMLYDSGKIEEIEYTIYNKWFKHFLEDIPKISIIYIQTEPSIAHHRVIKRDRKGEFISLDYLSDCHNYHEKWLVNTRNTKNNRVLTLNGNEDHEKNPQIINDWLLKILDFIFTSDKQL